MRLGKYQERALMVKAMEFIARQINDEDVFAAWLYNGVADGDIPYGDLDFCTEETYYDGLAWYITDEEFEELMGVFLRCMVRARKSGGLYCGEVCSQ